MGTQRELTEREEKANERRGGSRGGMRAMILLPDPNSAITQPHHLPTFGKGTFESEDCE